MQKTPHGRYQIGTQYLNENIMILKFMDQWNIQTAQQCVEDCLAAAQEHFSGEPWASVADYREWGLCTPDVMKYFNQAAHLFAQSQLTYQAVIPNNQLQSMIIDGYSEVISNKVTTKYFPNEDEAITWVREMLNPNQ